MAKAIVNCSTCANWQQVEGRDIDERGECQLAAQNFIVLQETGELHGMAAAVLHTQWSFYCQQHEPKQK